MKFYFKENKEIQIFRNISTPPPYTTCYITVYAHVQCREPKKGQQNNQILKQTTGLCWSVLFINLCSCHTYSKSSVYYSCPLSSIVSSASLTVISYFIQDISVQREDADRTERNFTVQVS